MFDSELFVYQRVHTWVCEKKHELVGNYTLKHVKKKHELWKPVPKRPDPPVFMGESDVSGDVIDFWRENMVGEQEF